MKIADSYINWFIDYIHWKLFIMDLFTHDIFIPEKTWSLYVIYVQIIPEFYKKKIIRKFRRNQDYIHWMCHLILRNIHNRIFI